MPDELRNLPNRCESHPRTHRLGSLPQGFPVVSDDSALEIFLRTDRAAIVGKDVDLVEQLVADIHITIVRIVADPAHHPAVQVIRPDRVIRGQPRVRAPIQHPHFAGQI